MHPGSTGCPPTCPWSWMYTLCGCHFHASTTLHPQPRLGRGFATGLCDYVNLCFVPGDPQCCRTDPFSPNQSFPPPIPFPSLSLKKQKTVLLLSLAWIRRQHATLRVHSIQHFTRIQPATLSGGIPERVGMFRSAVRPTLAFFGTGPGELLVSPHMLQYHETCERL